MGSGLETKIQETPGQSCEATGWEEKLHERRRGDNDRSRDSGHPQDQAEGEEGLQPRGGRGIVAVQLPPCPAWRASAALPRPAPLLKSLFPTHACTRVPCRRARGAGRHTARHSAGFREWPRAESWGPYRPGKALVGCSAVVFETATFVEWGGHTPWFWLPGPLTHLQLPHTNCPPVPSPNFFLCLLFLQSFEAVTQSPVAGGTW